MRYMVMSGTSDSTKVIKFLHEDENNFILATTVTDYGAKIAENAGATEVISKALKEEDFFIDKEKYEKNKLVMNITKHELTWTRFLGIDVMLRKSKYLGEDYEWYCKEGIPANCPKLLKEFCSYRYLRPLKIILNCSNCFVRSFTSLEV